MDKLIQYRLGNLKLDENSSSFVEEILSQPGVKNMVVLPDSFTKDKYLKAKNKVTIPSSTAIVSDREHFYPLFRSRGINCGMSVVSLPFNRENLDDKFLKLLFSKINYSLAYYFNYKLRLPFIKSKYDLSKNDFLSVLEKGAPYIANKFSLDNLGIENIEYGGAFKEIDLSGDKKYLNDRWLNYRNIRLRNSFGRYFGGNHFLEIQELVSDNAELGLSKGQLVVMFHTAGESLEDVIHPSIREKYINQLDYKYIDKNSEDYKYFDRALSVLMNFGFAYRLATAAIINDVVKESFGDDKQARIIIDRSHNHFTKEIIDGQEVIVYRHNAERLEAGGMAILSGLKDHNSYIIKAGSAIDKTFFTIDHGLGTVIEHNKQLSKKTSEVVEIHRFRRGINLSNFYKKTTKDLVFNPLVDDYFSLMNKEGIIYKLAEFKPIVNIKFI